VMAGTVHGIATPTPPTHWCAKCWIGGTTTSTAAGQPICPKCGRPMPATTGQQPGWGQATMEVKPCA